MKKGFGLIEVVVAATIITVFFVAILSTYSFFLKTLLGGTQEVQATFLLREGAEVSRILRDSSWSSNIVTATVGTEYYLSWNGSAWALTATPSYVDGLFDRTVTFESVYRDVNDDIASSGTVDGDTRLVTVNVAWKNSTAATTTKTLQTYLTNLYGN
jgi:prepilin-type N-terminal cleavage/methylation domain-containing protein